MVEGVEGKPGILDALAPVMLTACEACKHTVTIIQIIIWDCKL